MRADMTAAELIHLLLDDADMLDRVARANAPLVVARGGEMYQPDGYRNADLLAGYNVVRAYIMGIARDLGMPD